jgi:protease II
MIDNLQGQVGYGVAYIYFNYKEQDKQKPTHVLSSLTKQLISQASTQPLPEKLENFHKDQKTPNSGELYDILLDVTKFFTRTFFIFDALDECDQSSQRKELLPLFHRMGGNGMKLFLTSREHPEDVQISFEKISKMKLWAKDEDVATYIEQKISEYPQAESLVSQGNYRKKIISELTDCAKGM